MTHSELRFLPEFEKYVPGLRVGSGDNYMGFCPIHGEVPGQSKPSLSVNAATGLWHCFAGCGGGNIRTFLRLLGESSATIDRVAKKSSTKKARPAKREAPPDSLPERLLGVFDWCPTKLVSEGFSEKVLFENDVGYDKKLSRVTFPVRDKDGKLVGIVGKQPTSEFGKYKVYTTELLEYGLQVPTFSKGDHVWRLNKVATQLKTERKPVYIVEGFKAALWFCQAGINNVVALMGSHMTDAQKKLIESLTSQVILCLDNDDAGHAGSLKISQKLQAARISVVVLPEGIHQPDDLTAAELRELCRTPVSISEARRQWLLRPSP
jgi:DNA primase